MDDIIVACLPFIFAAGLNVTESGVKRYVARVLRLTMPGSIRLGCEVENYCVNLAVHCYSQMSYLFSLLVSSVTCLTVSVGSKHPSIGLVAASVLLIFVPVWLFRWQASSEAELNTTGLSSMKALSWCTIVVLLGLTLYSKLASNAP